METYTIRSQASGLYLNINGNTQVSPHRNVNLYASTGSPDQQWVIGSFSGNQLIKSSISESYALNAYRVGSPWNCDIYPWSGNTSDAEVYFEPVSSNVYRIRLAHHTGYYLTAQGTGRGSNVVWAAKNGSSSYQQWRIERVSSGGGGISKTLHMPANYNQKNYSEPVHSQGCALICGLDVSCYYGTSKYNNVQYFVNKYWGVNGYYWASPKAVMTDGTYSLSTIKAEIDAGHPVIVHSTGNGTQHWVVAFGYSNGAATVNDVQVLDPYQGVVRTLHDGMRITCGSNYNLDGPIKFTRAK